MAKIIIIEWDSQEMRLATMQGGSIDAAWAVPLRESSDEAVSATLRSEVDSRHLQKAEVLLAVSRRDVEIREIDIPPSPPEEHPDMLRMMAPREFTQFDDEAVVDFYEIGRRDEMHCMLAGSMTSARLKGLKKILQNAGLTPRWFALRPMCAAALLGPQPHKPRLVIDLASDEADIAVHDGQQVLSVRNIRLPHDNPDIALGKDIRRTMAVGANQLGRPVSEIILFGTPEEHATRIANWDLEPEVRCVCDFAPSSIKEPSKFASLFGLAKLEAEGESPAFDFLNPRQRPPEPAKVTPLMMAVGAGALAVLLIVGVVMLRLRALDTEVTTLRQDLAATQAAAVSAAGVMAHRDQIDGFLQSRVNWLEELQRVSKNSMEHEKVTFYKWNARASDRDGGGGTLLLDGYANSPETIDELEELLRDDGHIVDGRGHIIDPKNMTHPYRFRQLEVSISSPEILEDIDPEQAPLPAERGASGSPSDVVAGNGETAP